MNDFTTINAICGTPGSDEAGKNGCICPVLDNEHGRGYLGRGEEFGWVINGECPLHGEHSPIHRGCCPMQIDGRMDVGDFVKHFKRDLIPCVNLDYIYRITSLATHTETGERLVIYVPVYDPIRVYARPYDMFISEVDTRKYPNVKQKFRFERCSLEELQDIFQSVESHRGV